MLKCGFQGWAIITFIHFAGCWQRMHIMYRRARERHHAWLHAGFSRRLETPAPASRSNFWALLTCCSLHDNTCIPPSTHAPAASSWILCCLSSQHFPFGYTCLGAVCPVSCPCFFLLLFFFFFEHPLLLGSQKLFFPEHFLNLQSQILTTVLLSWFNVVSMYYGGLSSYNSWNSLQRCQPLGCSPELPLVISLMLIHANVVFPYLPYLNCIIMAYDKDCLQSAQATCKNWLSC